jgi:nitroreductase
MMDPFWGRNPLPPCTTRKGFMDPDTAGLRQRLDRVARVLSFAEAAGDESAARIAGMVLAELLDQAERYGIDTAPCTFQAARPSPRTASRPA